MRTLTIFLISLFSLPLVLNAQSVDEMLQKVSAAIEAGQNGQAVSYFRQTIALNIDRTEMYYWTNVDKNSEISSKLATELALAYKKNRNYDKAYLFYKELLQKTPNNVDCLEACAEMQVCRGQEKDAFCYSDQFTFQQRKRIRHVLSYSPLIPGVKKYTSTDTRSLSCDEQPPIQFRY